jgi:hypothetical protein
MHVGHGVPKSSKRGMATTVSVEPCKPGTWGLDPLFHAHVKLFLVQIDRMQRPPVVDTAHAAAADAVHFLRFARDAPPRPVRLVHVAGIVVHAVQYNKARNNHYSRAQYSSCASTTL